MEKPAPPDDAVALAGFSRLTTDVLERALPLHGVAIQAVGASIPRSAVIVVRVDSASVAVLDGARSAWPDTPIVVVTPVARATVRQAARRANAVALTTTAAGLEPLVHAIGVAVAGGRLNLAGDDFEDPISQLTERETQVLLMLGKGKSDTDMGIALGISPHTARTHVQNLMSKLGVRNRLAAAVVAREAGLTSRTSS